MSYLKELFTLWGKDIIKKAPKIHFEDFFDGLGLKVYIDSTDFYSSSYIKEKWFKRVYGSSEKIRKAFVKLEQILEYYQRRQEETNLISNLKIIDNSLLSKDEEITMERIVQFSYKSSIVIELVKDGVYRKLKPSRRHITLMQFLLKYFKACNAADFFKETKDALNINPKYASTHLVIYKNNHNLFSMDEFDSHRLITNIYHYEAIPGDILFYKFITLPDLETPPEDFVLLYTDEYPQMYFPFEGIRGKEILKFMNFLPVFQNKKGYRFPMIASNTPFVCRGEEEVVIGNHEHIKIEPSRKKLKEMFTDAFRRKGRLVLDDRQYFLETDKINFIASPRAEDSGFYPYELKVYHHGLTNVRHIPLEDTNDIIQRNPFIIFEYEYNTARWWMVEKGSLYGRRVTVENSRHTRIRPSMSRTFRVRDLDYTVHYYDLSQDLNYFFKIEYLDRSTIISLSLGSTYKKES